MMLCHTEKKLHRKTIRECKMAHWTQDISQMFSISLHGCTKDKSPSPNICKKEAKMLLICAETE